MASVPPLSAATEIIAPEDSVLIIRAPGVRDMHIRVPKGSEHRVTVSYAPIEMAQAERTQLCLISAGHLVTVRTPHHGNIMIPMMPTVFLGADARPVIVQRGEAAPPARSGEKPTPSGSLVEPPSPHGEKPTPSAIPVSRKRTPSDSLVERLHATRQGAVEWEQRCVQMVESYQALVAVASCPVCKTVALACPHFGPYAISQWTYSANYRGKNRAMTLNILSMELRGLIQTRRAALGGDTFLGITRFFVDAARREEFNRASLVPEWWALDCRSAAFKGAVESWRGLGWVSMCFKNCGGVVMFVHSRRLCDEKRKNVNRSKRVIAERFSTAAAAAALQELSKPGDRVGIDALSPGVEDVRRVEYSRDFKTIREEVLVDAIRAEAQVFGVCALGPEAILADAVRLLKKRSAWWEY